MLNLHRRWKLAGIMLCFGVTFFMLATSTMPSLSPRPLYIPNPREGYIDSIIEKGTSARGMTYNSIDVQDNGVPIKDSIDIIVEKDKSDKVMNNNEMGIQYNGTPIKDTIDRTAEKGTPGRDTNSTVTDVQDNGTSSRDMTHMTGGNETEVTGVTWSPVMDVLDEDQALKDAPLRHIKEMAHVQNSKCCIIDPRVSYKVGDEIKIGVQLSDGFGRRRTVGGDRLIVRIFEDSLGAKASGYILDHMNGTYTAVVKCLWKGNLTIQVALDFPRQVISLFYNSLRTNFRTIFVFYSNNERQPCQPTRTLLNTSRPICDMADRNGGMSWFCQAPESKGITCDDKIKIFNNNSYMNPVRKMPDAMLLRIRRSFLPPIKVGVQGQTTDAFKPPRTPPCISYNKTQLWFLPSPVGYFMHDEWKINHCTAPTQKRLPDCLRNKHFIFFGDSTTLQWADNLCQRFKLKLITKLVFAEGFMFKIDISRFSDTLNLTVDWVAHSLPGNRFRNASTSIAKHIQLFKGKKNMVFVIHIYVHIITHHHSVWRDRLRHIRQSIEIFLLNNPDAKFLIKGGNGVHPERFFRYAHYLYRRILIEEFKGLYDKVIYLDNADATTASGLDILHPGYKYVSGMVDQMLAYICQ